MRQTTNFRDPVKPKDLQIGVPIFRLALLKPRLDMGERPGQSQAGTTPR